MEAFPWSRLESDQPSLADFGRERIDGRVAYLATIRADGRPRAHPVTPIIGHGRCYLFVEPSSPKSRDLSANGQFCLHCGMSDSSGASGEFQISGQAVQLESGEERELAEAVATYKPSSRSLLFELRITEALSTRYRGGQPSRMKWTSSEPVSA